MKKSEYQKVKNYSYEQYCNYLQNKYGLGKYDYMTKSWNHNPKSSRTKEGLYCHHKYEDRVINLNKPEWGKNYPYEWQKKENLVYSDLLEHLLLHIMIRENPSKDADPNQCVGLGGIINFIVPELNDVYCDSKDNSWKNDLPEWQKTTYQLVEKDKDVYFELLKRIKNQKDKYPGYTLEWFLKSNYQNFTKNPVNNTKLFNEIKKILK